jgi:hypothetical protein
MYRASEWVVVFRDASGPLGEGILIAFRVNHLLTYLEIDMRHSENVLILGNKP